MSLIQFDHVTYTFGNGVTAVDDFSCSIDVGEFVFLVGPSGAGKTTLLRLLLRELVPTSGKIILDNVEISQKKVSITDIRRKVGASFQDIKLLNDRTIKENIALVMEMIGRDKEEIDKAVQAVLDLVGLKEKADFFPAQLSGGEIQRIGIARAVVRNPLVVFADEPTANLDDETAWKIGSLLKEIHRSGKTIIVATHNIELVDSMEERVVHIGKGKIITDQKKGKYHKP